MELILGPESLSFSVITGCCKSAEWNELFVIVLWHNIQIRLSFIYGGKLLNKKRFSTHFLTLLVMRVLEGGCCIDIIDFCSAWLRPKLNIRITRNHLRFDMYSSVIDS